MAPAIRRHHPAVQILLEREGFEPSKAKPTDLQSAPFDHSGISPIWLLISHDKPSPGIEPETSRLQVTRSAS